MNIKSTMSVITGVLIIFAFTTLPSILYAGGYFITDKDGRVISEDSEKTIILGPTEKSVVFNDYNGTKVFDIQWNADEKTLIITGDNIHLKIYSNGRIEKWTELKEGGEEQYPITIEPVVPIFRDNKSNKN
jgi:hypothetical protein